MGRSSKPARWLIEAEFLQWEEFQTLSAQGHELFPLPDEYDLVISPRAWQMDESLRPYLLSHALPAARKAADKRKAG
jgi:hypothetical protein